MSTSLLVVTPSPIFGELIRRSLEQTESYRVHVVNSKAAAIVRADEESCKLAFLDLDLGEAWVNEVGESLRTIIPNIKLFVLAGDETLPAFDSIRPWTLIRKPFQLPDVLQTIGPSADADNGPSSKGTAARDLLWLSDVNKAAQHLTRLTLESSSQAALITRENAVWAYAGQLSQAAAQEVAKALSRNWDSAKGGDLLRFVRLDSTKAEHMLYATQLGEGMLLAMVFDAETPFSTIRSQAGQLATSLAEGESVKEPLFLQEDELEPAAPPMSEMEDDDDATPLPPISEILKDIPIPDPRVLKPPARMDVAPSAPSVTTQRPPAESSRSMPAAYAEPADPDATRPSIFSHESPTPMRMKKTLTGDAAPSNPQANTASQVESLDATVASHAPVRPETPIRIPLPGELDETRPQTRAELPTSNLNVGPIVMEPISAGVYHLAYACLLVPRMASHYLTGDMADKISEWLPIICVAFGWRLEYLAVRPEYLQWVANVPPATSPGYLMRVMRQQISDKIFASFPRLKRDNPSGDFWAPGYLIMGGTQPHPPQLVKDYIKQIRQRQGAEKPVTKTPRS